MPTGEIVADSGFRPDQHGFPFENYGPMENGRNLGAREMRALFGSRVCIRIVDGACRLTAVAREWMQDVNAAMDGGHCYGFAVMSLLLFKNELPASRRGGMPSGPAFGMPLNPMLQRNIAYTWAWQLLDSVADRSVVGSPKAVLEKLIDHLRSGGREAYTLGFYNRTMDAGHAITPYAVESKGDGQYVILVYDNNSPGITTPFHVDTVRNTWRYDLAALNPDYESDVWEGDAKTRSMALEPMTPGLGAQPCPICEGSRGAVNRISLTAGATNHPNLLVKDRFGRRVGWVGKKLVNEIPGARVIRPVTGQPWQDKPEPEYQVPVSGGRLSVTIDGRRMKRRSKADVRVIGPGYFTAVEDISVSPGDVDTMSVGARGERLRYRTKRSESPNVGLAFERNGVSWNFAALAYDVETGATLDLRVDKRRGRLHFANEGGTGGYSVAAFRDSKRTSLDWGANFDIDGSVRAEVAYERRIRDDNGKPGIPITWFEEGGISYTDSLDRDYQDE